jgi:hypothetical protein
MIFPGVRIERHGIDRTPGGPGTINDGSFDGLGGKRRRRKTS